MRHARGHRDGPRSEAPLRPQSLQHRVRRTGRFLRRQRNVAHGDRRPPRVPRPQRHAGAPAAMRASGCPARSAPGSIRAPPSRPPSIWRQGKSARSSSSWARARTRRKRGNWRTASAESTPPTRRWKACGSTGATRWAPSTSKHPTPRSMCWPTAGCSTRRWPAACGRAAATTRSGGAFGFRDQLQDAMALVHCRAAAAARASAALRGPSVSRRRRAALVASARGPRRAHAFFRRLSVAAAGDLPLCAGTGDTACWTKRAAFSRAARSTPTKNPTTTCRVVRRHRHVSTSIACARSSTACASASTACR